MWGVRNGRGCERGGRERRGETGGENGRGVSGGEVGGGKRKVRGCVTGGGRVLCGGERKVGRSKEERGVGGDRVVWGRERWGKREKC